MNWAIVDRRLLVRNGGYSAFNGHICQCHMILTEGMT
jgi:hypothetical protein